MEELVNNKCVLCGADLIDGVCPNAEQHCKRMCINCKFICEGACANQEHMDNALATVRSSVPNGYKISSISMEALPLRDATKSCSKHVYNDSVIPAHIIKMIGGK